MTPIEDTRRGNLRALIARWGTAVALAQALGHSNSSYLTHLMQGRKPFSEKTARSIESKLALESGWMDIRIAGSATPVINTRLLEQVVIAVSTSAAKHHISPGKLSVIVVEVYTNSIQNGAKVDPDQVERLVKLAE